MVVILLGLNMLKSSSAASTPNYGNKLQPFSDCAVNFHFKVRM